MRTEILSFLSISYADVEDNDQDFLVPSPERSDFGRKEFAGKRTGILSFLSISYVDVEDNDQDFWVPTVSVSIYMLDIYIYFV